MTEAVFKGNNLPARNVYPAGPGQGPAWGAVHWGEYSSAASLPNVGADAADVQAGDMATVSGRLYVCRSGTSGSAVWDALDATAASTPSRIFNVPGLSDLAGADISAGGKSITAAGATSLYYGEIFIPYRFTITNINVLQGTTGVGTDNMRVHLYNSAGTHLAQNAVAGEATSGADTFLQCALETAYTAAPGRYFVGVAMAGTTTEFQVVAASCPYGISEVEGGHAFAEDGVDITSVATGFTADAAPVFFLD